MSELEQQIYLLNGQRAKSVAGWLYSDETLFEGKGDAFRHAYFSALNTMSLGKDLAKKLGDAHELHEAETPAGREMDLFNNQFGRDIVGSLAPKYITSAGLHDAIKGAIIQGIDQGQLKMIVGDKVVFTNWTKK